MKQSGVSRRNVIAGAVSWQGSQRYQDARRGRRSGCGSPKQSCSVAVPMQRGHHTQRGDRGAGFRHGAESTS
jgi:hypothetical protein